ncbi:MAG: DUF4231 domain-containing protein [Symploca sp. SIO2C1]|nr:DUF4231 domain-containing protein [Symploca sp. SIO2C1]
MAKKNSYQEYLKQEFTELIDKLELPDLNKQFMKSRWLDQLLWLEGKAERASKWSTRLRLTTIVGGVLIPALVSLNFNDNQLGKRIGWFTFGLSQIVAISAAVEEYFHFGDKSTQYRQTAELLKSDAWKFFQLGGSYQEYSDHMQAYPNFALRVEQFIQEDVQSFVELTKESANKEQQQQKKENQKKNPSSLATAVSSSESGNT